MCQVADVSNVTHLYLPRDNLHYHACIHDTKADSYWRLLLKVGSKTNIMVNFKIVENKALLTKGCTHVDRKLSILRIERFWWFWRFLSKGTQNRCKILYSNWNLVMYFHKTVQISWFDFIGFLIDFFHLNLLKV